MSKVFKPIVVNGAIAEVRDTAVYAHKGVDLDFGKKNLVQHDDFIKSLNNPNTRAFNIENLFERNLRPLIGDLRPLIGGSVGSHDSPILIAENDDSQAIATTTVTALAKNGTDTTDIHIIINKEFGRSMIIGDAMPRRIKNAFAKVGIRYVDRDEKNALAEIKEGIADVVGLKVSELRDAFLYRNDVSPQVSSINLAERLAEKKGSMLYNKFLVKI